MSKKKKILISTLSVLLISVVIAGFSYAYWRLTYTQTGVNKLVSSCFSMELANEKNNITLDSAYPISDEKGKALTPYSFTITNTCDLFASYTINLEMLEGTTLNSKYIKSMLNSEAITNLNDLETTDTSIAGAVESRILFRGSLGSGDSTDYTLRIWMDSDTPATEDTMNKIFQGKITVTAEVSTYSPVENGFTLLNEALLVNEYQTTNVDVAKNKIESKQAVDFKKTAPIIDWKEVINQNIIIKNIEKADKSLIGSYGVEEKTTKVLLSKEYTFDSGTGMYYLKNPVYYNLEDVDYETEKYYLCGSSIVATSNNTIADWDGTSCSTLFYINSLNSISDGTIDLQNGTTLKTNIYKLNTNTLYGEVIESDKSDKGLYKSQDDDGNTYYYRGNVTNNYVKFAGYYWRIIRINGDGSIRLLYTGTSASSEGSAQSIGQRSFNSINSNPTYVGYMFSSTLNSSYEDTIKNDNNSTVKNFLDSWYETNILTSGFSSYVADSGFCNDRSIAASSPGAGVTAEEMTYYSGRIRVLNSTPTLTCNDKLNNLFTLQGNTNGNGSLTHPIGLITVDELMYAGSVWQKVNKMTYTFSNGTYLTMTPGFFTNTHVKSYVYRFNSDGLLGDADASIYYAIRPVINLKSDTEITGGIGTANDPFIIK